VIYFLPEGCFNIDTEQPLPPQQEEENTLAQITDQRNALADQISGVLEGAEFNNQPINQQQAKHLIQQAEKLLDQVNAMA
jgi:hypothetical protein